MGFWCSSVGKLEISAGRGFIVHETNREAMGLE